MGASSWRHGVGQALHLGDATEVPLQLLELTAEEMAYLEEPCVVFSVLLS